MKHKLFLDTNILLDFCLPERPDPKGTVCLFSDIEFRAVNACIHSGQLKDLYYVLDGGTTEEYARSNVAAALNALEVVSLTPQICQQAVRCDEPDFEDALIRICAEQEKAHFIISRDEKAFLGSAVKRLSAEEYIEQFGDWHEIDFSLEF